MFITLRQEGRGTLEYLPVENKQFLIVFYAEDVQKKKIFQVNNCIQGAKVSVYSFQ